MPADVRNRRRLLFDPDTVKGTFAENSSVSGSVSDGGQVGLEPAQGAADEDNGGNAFPHASGIPGSEVEWEFACYDGGPVGAPLFEGGAEMRFKKTSESNDFWRGNSWKRAKRVGYTTEVVRQRVATGTSVNSHRHPTGLVIPEGDNRGRIVAAVGRRTNSGFPANYAVDVMYRDSQDAPTWTRVADVVGGTTGPRSPSIVRRPDGVLIIYYVTLNSSGTGYELDAVYSVDDGESWAVLGTDLSSVSSMNDIDKLTVLYANGYFVCVATSSVGNEAHWMYSVDGGVSFRHVAEVSPASSSIRLATAIPLIDDTILFVWIEETGASDILNTTRVAAGLDYPDVNAGYNSLFSVTAGTITGLAVWLDYDGSPFVGVYDEGIASSPLIRVLRGTVDGNQWIDANDEPGLFDVWEDSASAVVADPDGFFMMPYQGTWALLWINEGVADAAFSAVEEASVNLTYGAGNSNISVGWNWQFCWTMSAGTPVGTNVPFLGIVLGAPITWNENPTYVNITGDGSSYANWVTTTTILGAANSINTDCTAVASAVYRVNQGGDLTADAIAILARGSDGVQSVEAHGRLTTTQARIADVNGDTIATADHDFTQLQEVILAVTSVDKGTGEFAYVLAARPWLTSDGDRVWYKLAVGTHTPSTGAGTGTTGIILFGSVAPLASGDNFDLIMGSFTLNQASSDFSGGEDGLFGTGIFAVTRGPVAGPIPTYIQDGFYVSWSGDIAAQGDSYTVGTTWQFGPGNVAPGERGPWITADTLTDHHCTLDYGVSNQLGPWDVLALWGTNYPYATVQHDNNPSFSSPVEESLSAVVYAAVCSSINVANGSTHTRMVRVQDAAWEPGQWVGKMFRWETGAKAGLAGRIVHNDTSRLIVEDTPGGDGWTVADAQGETFIIYEDRMFVVKGGPQTARRYMRILIPQQGTPDGKFVTHGFMRTKSLVPPSNWEWEDVRRRMLPVETVEAPGGDRYVYELGAERQELDVEWTGIHGAGRGGLTGLWRSGRGGARVCGILWDTEGGPDAFIPARIVGDLVTTTRALYTQGSDTDDPILAVVDVDTLTFSEEVK